MSAFTKFISIGICLSVLALAGCQGTGSVDDLFPKAERPIPADIVKAMKAKGMKASSPIMLRIFKQENLVEVWKQADSGRYELLKDYEICKWSGKLGPKIKEGDRQAPEGYYDINEWQMNPRSDYFLSFNLGFPNAFDRSLGRTGTHLMMHGACSSAGCYSMTDERIAEIFALAREAFNGGQKSFQVQAFPFRMTPQNMAEHRDDPNFEFWKMLKEGYDHFEITRVPPKVNVCERRYVFNRIAEEEKAFKATEACPQTTTPDTLSLAYGKLLSKEDEVFRKAIKAEEFREKLAGKTPEPVSDAGASLKPEEKPDFSQVASTNAGSASPAAPPAVVPVPETSPRREGAAAPEPKKQRGLFGWLSRGT